jgi:Holliday junction resolvasome RuvABC DNA-binding subunit
MKGNFEFDDIQRMDVDQRLYKDIIKSLKGFGYDAERIKGTLQKYEGKISKENMSEVIKWVIGQM